VSLLVSVTIACALAALAGAVGMARRADRPPDPAAPPPGDARAGIAGPLGRLRAVVDAGDWRRAAPPLLALGGILGIMLFGSLALIFVYDQGRSGWPMLGLAVVTLGWTIVEYVRSGSRR